MAVKEGIVHGAFDKYIRIHVYENGCLISEMVLSSAETWRKLTAFVCVPN